MRVLNIDNMLQNDNWLKTIEEALDDHACDRVRFTSADLEPTPIEENLLPPVVQPSFNFNTQGTSPAFLNDNDFQFQGGNLNCFSMECLEQFSKLAPSPNFSIEQSFQQSLDDPFPFQQTAPVPSQPLPLFPAVDCSVATDCPSAADGPSQGSITEPRSLDVVCTRGKRFYGSQGCTRFRAIIDSFKTEYHNASTRIDKSVLIDLVMDTVMDDGKARFLRYDASSNSFSVMEKDLVRDKIAHALRDAAAKDHPSPRRR